jgi:phosphohistidine phosphatase
LKATIMRRLIILRHAKAERASAGMRDYDRPLAARGREDATKVAAYLAQQGLAPDHALVSPAKRTRETWQLVAAAMSPMPFVKYDERLYDASAETILKVIREAPPAAHSVCVVGHNPGLHQLCLLIVGAGNRGTLDGLAQGLPTSGLVVIELKAVSWDKLQPQGGHLDRFVSLRQGLE